MIPAADARQLGDVPWGGELSMRGMPLLLAQGSSSENRCGCEPNQLKATCSIPCSWASDRLSSTSMVRQISGWIPMIDARRRRMRREGRAVTRQRYRAAPAGFGAHCPVEKQCGELSDEMRVDRPQQHGGAMSASTFSASASAGCAQSARSKSRQRSATRNSLVCYPYPARRRDRT